MIQTDVVSNWIQYTHVPKYVCAYMINEKHTSSTQVSRSSVLYGVSLAESVDV